MGRIRILDDATINRIAAGEVIERPASVVKELVENSLDSGATSMTVSVEDGGKKLIRVRDDGCGMSREDAQAAFTRHATSKITSIDDLLRLGSYGFRGEALASVASVSNVTLRTREHGAEEGTEVRIAGGRILSVSAVGAPEGTEVAVENIFQNIPARRKSLKSRNIELGHCREIMIDYLLCKPGLSFSIRSDESVEMVHVPAEGMNGSLATAFGSKVARDMLRGQVEDQGVRIETFLARLEHTRASPSEIRLFVNDRPVKSQRMISAVIKAFGSRLMKDRYPIGVVRLFVEAPDVDVNVHPAKREVRFNDEVRVLDVLEKCVGNALQGPDLSFRYDLTKFAESFSPTSVIPAGSSLAGNQATLSVEEPGTEAEPSTVIVPLSQIMNTYILAESRGNLLLIDQHAASERIVYERILASLRTGKDISQRLLTPLVIILTATEARVLEENQETLVSAGFSAEPFGKGTYAIRSLPTVLGVAQGELAFRNLLDDLAHMAPAKKLGLEVIWRVACHAAIRAGESLSGPQMRQLVADLVRAESPFTCEHGRPTMIVLSPMDLEKLFKRRV